MNPALKELSAPSHWDCLLDFAGLSCALPFRLQIPAILKSALVILIADATSIVNRIIISIMLPVVVFEEDSSREAGPWEDELSEHQTGGRKAVSAASVAWPRLTQKDTPNLPTNVVPTNIA